MRKRCERGWQNMERIVSHGRAADQPFAELTGSYKVVSLGVPLDVPQRAAGPLCNNTANKALIRLLPFPGVRSGSRGGERVRNFTAACGRYVINVLCQSQLPRLTRV